MSTKLPRLNTGWNDQPGLFERQWDTAMTAIEKGGGGAGNTTLTIYQRYPASPTPPLPSVTTTYTFSTATLTGLDNGWSAVIPAKTSDPLWVSTVAVIAAVDVVNIDPSLWQPAQILVEDGEAGPEGTAGSDGAPGAPGADGTTLYTWIAYADSADGTVNFSVGSPTGRHFIGISINNTTPTESTTPSDYTWSAYSGPPNFGLVNGGNVNVANEKVTKISGTNGSWDASAYSSEAWIGACTVSIKAGDLTGGYIAGLNTDPTTDAGKDSIDFGFYFNDVNNRVDVYENGSSIFNGTTGSAWLLTDVFAISYDGKNIRYFKNGSLITSHSATTGLRLYVDTSLKLSNSSVVIAGFSAAGAAGADGADGIDGSGVVGFLSNESATVAADNSGTVSSFAGTGGQLRVFDGLTEVTGSCTFSVVSSSGVTIVGPDSSGFYSVSAMSADTGTATLRATYGTIHIDKIYSISKARAGANGSPGKIIVVVSDRQTITYDSGGSVSPSTQTTTFTAQKQNTSATVNWTMTRLDGTSISSSTYLSATSGDTVTMTAANFNTARGSTNGVIVTGTVIDGVTISDTISVVKVQAGATGATGGTGPQGPTGGTGPQGPTGPSGPSGPSGSGGSTLAQTSVSASGSSTGTFSTGSCTLAPGASATATFAASASYSSGTGTRTVTYQINYTVNGTGHTGSGSSFTINSSGPSSDPEFSISIPNPTGLVASISASVTITASGGTISWFWNNANLIITG